MFGNLQLVIFDMGGTTIADNGVVAESFENTLRDYGLAVSAQQLSEVRGRSKREALRVLFSDFFRGKPALFESRFAAAYDRFQRRLKQGFEKKKVSPVPGTQKTFDWLCSKDIKIALTTGFDRGIASTMLEQLGWNDGVIESVVCSDEVVKGRPAPDLIFKAMQKTGVTSVRQTVAVGDTVSDVLAAHHAGVAMSFGVLTGSHNKSQLVKYPHTALLNSVTELPEYLLNLQGVTSNG